MKSLTSVDAGAAAGGTATQGDFGMFRRLGLAALLALAVAVPMHEAAAQDALGGAIFGGAAGAIVGGALGGGRGAAIGAVLGAGTGAAVAAEGE